MGKRQTARNHPRVTRVEIIRIVPDKFSLFGTKIVPNKLNLSGTKETIHGRHRNAYQQHREDRSGSCRDISAEKAPGENAAADAGSAVPGTARAGARPGANRQEAEPCPAEHRDDDHHGGGSRGACLDPVSPDSPHLRHLDGADPGGEGPGGRRQDEPCAPGRAGRLLLQQQDPGQAGDRGTGRLGGY